MASITINEDGTATIGDGDTKVTLSVAQLSAMRGASALSAPEVPKQDDPLSRSLAEFRTECGCEPDELIDRVASGRISVAGAREHPTYKRAVELKAALKARRDGLG